MAVVIFVCALGSVIESDVIWDVFFLAMFIVTIRTLVPALYKVILVRFVGWNPLNIRMPTLQGRKNMQLVNCGFLVLMCTLAWHLALERFHVGDTIPEFMAEVMTLGLFFYLFYYIFGKVVLGEPIRFRTWLLFLMWFVTTVIAVQFFNIVIYDKRFSPEDSRDRNEDCVLLDFYDYHDIWHFLSAISIFFNAVFILHVDDGMEKRPTNQICEI